MADKAKARVEARERRHRRVRRRLSGSTARPRLTVFRSNRHIYAQIVDDLKGVTLVAASTQDEELRGKVQHATRETAAAVGGLLAKRAVSKEIKQVVFDRGGYLYHGRIKALADAARAGGLEF